MIKYELNYLYFSNKVVELPSEIKDVIFFQGIYVILLKSCAYGKKYNQYSNLCCYNKEGEELWYAELPPDPGGRYYKVKKQEKKIIAYSEWSYYCIIDPQTGKVIEQVFTK